MKRLIHSIFILTLFVVAFPVISNAQCHNFNEASCKETLSPYMNYGNYISTTLTDGEYAELNMTFYSNQEYRIAICGMESVPKLEFRVFDAEHNLLYKNKDNEYSRTWDFKLDASQQLIIAIIVPETQKSTTGCIAVFNGIKAD